MNEFDPTKDQINTFGESMQNFREARDLSQEAFASLIKVSRWSVNRWENGLRFPAFLTRRKISRVLGFDICCWVGQKPVLVSLPIVQEIKPQIIKKQSITQLAVGAIRSRGEVNELVS